MKRADIEHTFHNKTCVLLQVSISFIPSCVAEGRGAGRACPKGYLRGGLGRFWAYLPQVAGYVSIDHTLHHKTYVLSQVSISFCTSCTLAGCRAGPACPKGYLWGGLGRFRVYLPQVIGYAAIDHTLHYKTYVLLQVSIDPNAPHAVPKSATMIRALSFTGHSPQNDHRPSRHCWALSTIHLPSTRRIK